MTTRAVMGLGALALALAAVSGAADAQAPARPNGPPPPPARGPATSLALEAARTAIETCAANGYKVGVVVLNSSGAQRVMVLADGAPDMTGQIANDPKLITWAGGQPLTVGGEVIGAIAVSGAPGGDKDDVCTSAGVARIQGRLN